MKDINEEIRKLYLELQNEAGFKIGDKVKVTREAESFENGWQEVWVSNKDKFVGKTFEIKRINNWGISLIYTNEKSAWHFPYFILEKVVEQTYHIGQHFIYNEGNEYLLASVGDDKVNLFNLSNGGKWSSSIKVCNGYKITEDEMKKLADTFGMWKGFKLKGE